MTDRRLTPFNGRVAALHLKGTVAAERFAEPEAHRVVAPLSDLRAAPDGYRWVRVDRDAYLVEVASGLIAEALIGVLAD